MKLTRNTYEQWLAEVDQVLRERCHSERHHTPYADAYWLECYEEGLTHIEAVEDSGDENDHPLTDC